MTSGRPTSEDEVLDDDDDEVLADDEVLDDRSASSSDDRGDTSEPGGAGEPEQAGRSWGTTAIAIGLVVAVVLGGFRIISLTSERDELTEQVAALEESLRIARGDLGGQIDQLEEDVIDLTDQLDQLQALLTDAASEIAGLTEQLTERDEQIEELTEQLTELQDIVDITGTEIELMPDLLGTPIEEVRELALELGVELVELPTAPGNVIARPGDVIEQLPLEDTPLLPGSVVWVEVFTPLENDETGG